MTSNETFFAMIFDKQIMRRALRVSAVVGTLLCIINQWEAIFIDGKPDFLKVVLTYLVPFGVSTYSAVLLKKELTKRIE